jgi:hypothetical protein
MRKELFNECSRDEKAEEQKRKRKRDKEQERASSEGKGREEKGRAIKLQEKTYTDQYMVILAFCDRLENALFLVDM